ncbi:unnamed protein product [Cylicocyclus nassatus]|uniref:Uncharacterized protein n=1 Tax=Cylicocyclus nassatus TaxID=53992 RepID=A0AA36HC44_CYLNA|nr:unnamed protein product [Cylicocyclus nassatus]
MQDLWNIILSFANHLGYSALMFTNTNVAADRFMSFFMKEIQESLVSNRTAYAIFASIPWIASILISKMWCLTQAY